MNVLVTGGGGFLGGAIVRLLAARGDAVRSISRNRHPWMDALGVQSFLGDVADISAVRRALAGVGAVVHTAAKAGVWGRYEEFYHSNVLGTQSVIEACRDEGVSRLVYTSSPSVVHGGGDMEGVDESAAYPNRYQCHYASTKAEAERSVLRANGPGLSTVALRPHLIWGPGDNHLTPRILERGRLGRLRKIGSSAKLVDATYIDNAANAHLLALDRLSATSPAAGRAYFIANGEPIAVWSLINKILEAGGIPPVTRTMPTWLSLSMAAVMETGYRLFRKTMEPPLTRFTARQLSTAHWFDLSAAKRDLGYEAVVTTAEGLERLRRHLLLNNPRSPSHSGE